MTQPSPPGQQHNLGPSALIRRYLSARGAASSEALSVALSLPRKAISGTLSRLCRSGEVIITNPKARCHDRTYALAALHKPALESAIAGPIRIGRGCMGWRNPWRGSLD